MARPTLPADHAAPWADILRNGIYAVSDNADTALSNASAALTAANNAQSTANTLSTTVTSNSNSISTLNTSIATKAEDSAVVHKTGNETVAGIKTFSSAPVVPDASFAIAKTNGLQSALDAKASSSGTVLTTGNQTVAGVKTFSSAPVVPDGSFVATKLDSATLTEFIQDAVAAFIVQGSGVVVTYNDTSNTLTLASNSGIYAQRHWDSVAGWEARPSVPTGVAVTADSSLDIDAPPPPGALRYDRWYPHPNSSYWPA